MVVTRPVVIPVITRDDATRGLKTIGGNVDKLAARTVQANKAVADSNKAIASQVGSLSTSNMSLRKSQLAVIAAQERYANVAKNSKATVGQLASAQSSLIGSQQRLAKATDSTSKSAETATRNSGRMRLAAAAAGIAIVAGARAAIQAATDQNKANAQTEAVIKSTGGAAHVTAQQVSELSGKLSEQTGIQDDVIQGGANMLLTFTNIRNEAGKGNDIFNQTTKVVTDMSVALGQDFKSSAIQVGKALNDPIKGMTALQRVGVSFSAEQVTTIKRLQETGHTLEAQKLILTELNKEFGGSAAAQATAADKMSAKWNNLQEQIGNKLLPAFNGVLSVASTLIDVFSQYSGVLVPLVAVLGVTAVAVWAVNKASWAWVQTQKALVTVLGETRVAALGAVAGPLAAAAAAFAGLMIGAKLLTDAISGADEAMIKAGSRGIKDFNTSLMQSGGVFDTNTQKILANTLVTGGYVDKAAKAGISVRDLTAGVTGNDAAMQNLVETWRASGAPSDATIGSLRRIHEQFQAGTASGLANADAQNRVNGAVKAMGAGMDAGSIAIAKQNEFLKANNLTVETAKAKYDAAVTSAYSLTAQLGYMSTALDQLSGKTITSTLGQLQLTDSLGTEADHWAATREQVKQHSTSLDINTVDGRANREWMLQHIQAINTQAIAYATATGSVGKGTTALGTNTGAMRTAMLQAGFTTTQVDALIRKYAATPKDVETSIRQQGAQAVQQSLQDLEYWLHRIADPNWAAHIDIIAGANAAQGGHPAAAGGLIVGRGGPTADRNLIAASNGEYVVNAAATAQNLSLLDAINNRNRIKTYAAGGLVGHLNLSDASAIHVDISNAIQKAKSAFISSSTGPALSGNISALQQYAASLFGQYGWSVASQLQSLINLWNGESGWNSNAVNASSGAWGIPQSLPGDKMASAGADWRTNGATQIRWGESYIASVYGSPAAAWSAWLSRSPHWYGSGLTPTVFRRPTLIGVGDRGPETVSVTPGRGGGGFGDVHVHAGAISVYAAAGQDPRQIARMAVAQLRQMIDDERRRAAKGRRA
jgi:hypothetical protein